MTLLLAALPVLAAGILLAGLLFQRRGQREDARRFPMPGRLIATPAGILHLNESGSPEGPTVVLESGLAGSSLSWVFVQRELAPYARVCSYDRAGFGWSCAFRSPRTLTALIEELRQLLLQGQLAPPYFLVGHSYGGLIARAFAHLYPDQTAGLILVDPVSTEHWAACSPNEQQRLRLGIRLARRGALLAHLGVIRLTLSLVVLGRRFVPQVVARVSAPGAASFLQRLTREIQKLPPPLWPIVRAQWSRPTGFRSISSYLEALQANCLEAERQQFVTAAPTVILSAGTATPAELKERDRWLRSSRDGQHTVVSDSGHWIQVERPEAVVGAVRSLVAKYKTNCPEDCVTRK